MAYRPHLEEFMNWALSDSFKTFFSGNLTEGGEGLKFNFWPRGSL